MSLHNTCPQPIVKRNPQSLNSRLAHHSKRELSRIVGVESTHDTEEWLCKHLPWPIDCQYSYKHTGQWLGVGRELFGVLDGALLSSRAQRILWDSPLCKDGWGMLWALAQTPLLF